MRAFFYISLIASLAFPALVSAAPQPVANENDIVARSASGVNYLPSVYSSLQGPCNAITSASSSQLLDIEWLTGQINEITSIISTAHSTVNSNHGILNGLDQSSCSNQLGLIINLVVEVINVVLGILSSCSAADQVTLKALLTVLFSLLGDLVCLVLNVVVNVLGGLLGIILGLLIGLLDAIVGLLVGIIVDLSGCFVSLPGCGSHWPTGLGGSVVLF
jgi:hypothetical protein